MDKMGDYKDREAFLYVKKPEDYQLGYHQKLQEGRSKTTLRQNPTIKIDKYVTRDQASYNRKALKIINDKRAAE